MLRRPTAIGALLVVLLGLGGEGAMANALGPCVDNPAFPCFRCEYTYDGQGQIIGCVAVNEWYGGGYECLNQEGTCPTSIGDQTAETVECRMEIDLETKQVVYSCNYETGQHGYYCYECCEQ